MAKLKDRELVDLVYNRFNLAKQNQNNTFQNLLRFYQLYRGVYDSSMQNYKGRAQLFIPKVFSTVETIVPRMIGNKPKIEAAPREPKDIGTARGMSKLIGYRWDQLNMKRVVKQWVRQSLINGIGIVKTTWAFDDDKDQPCVELVDLFDFFVDPDAATIENADYVIHRVAKNIDKVKENKNYKVPDALNPDYKKDPFKTQRDAIMGMTTQDDSKKEMVELVEYWGLADIGDGMEECLIVVANGTYLLRAEKNPFAHGKKPFIKLDDIDVHLEFWSIGEPEMLESLQYELNDVRNQRMDNVNLILNRMWLVAKGADVDEDDLVSRPGGIVHAMDINGIKELSTADVTMSAYNEESLIKADIQDTSGVSDYAKGIGNSSSKGTPQGNDTATGMMILQEAGNQRFRYKLDNLEDSLRELGKQMVALEQQFLDRDIFVRIMGQSGLQWEKLSPDDIKGAFDITVEAGSTQPMNKSIRRAEARELLAQMSPLAALGVNLKPIIEYLLSTYEIPEPSAVFQGQQQMVSGPMAPQGGPAVGTPGQFNQQVVGGAQGAVAGGANPAQGNRPQQKLANPTLPSPTQGMAPQGPIG